MLISNFPSTLNLFSLSISNNLKKIILLLNLKELVFNTVCFFKNF